MTDNIYTFNKYIITYPNTINIKLFECKWYRGITFLIEDRR